MKPRGRILHQPVILLVEDEPHLRTVEAEVLHEAGFWVLEAQDADEAFERLKRREDIRLVLTDVAMPGSLNGFEFARLMAQGWPEVGLMVISGKAPPKEGDLPLNAVFIPKAVNSKTLVEKVRSIMSDMEARDGFLEGARHPPHLGTKRVHSRPDVVVPSLWAFFVSSPVHRCPIH